MKAKIGASEFEVGLSDAKNFELYIQLLTIYESTGEYNY